MVESLLTFPPAMAAFLNSSAGAVWRERLTPPDGGRVFVCSDPPGRRLGSGGGTVNLLYEAWRATGAGAPLESWLRASQKLILHAGGESRRLPAYAGVGKAFIPLPLLPSLPHQRYDQLLCDFQLPDYTQLLREAGARAVAMVASGDVWLDFDALQLPLVESDITGIGMRVPPEMAQHFGVFFVSRGGRQQGTAERRIAFFLQKPSVAEICRHLGEYDFFVDTGMWLLSAPAAEFLFRYCGWDPARQLFGTPEGTPAYLDLYTEIGTALGHQGPVPPGLQAAGFDRLSRGLVPLDEARFLHLGTNAQLLDFLSEVQERGQTRQPRAIMASRAATLAPGSHLPVWVDACLCPPLVAEGRNLLTGLPAASRLRQVPPGICVDVVPVGTDAYGFRAYHLNDSLRGQADATHATICGQPAAAWLRNRGLPVPASDVFDLAIYPVLPAEAIDQELLDWFTAAAPDASRTARILGDRPLTARAIADAMSLPRYFAQRQAGGQLAIDEQLRSLTSGHDGNLLDQDFGALADVVRTHMPELQQWLLANQETIRQGLYRAEYRARFDLFLAAAGPRELAAARTEHGFQQLRHALVHAHGVQQVQPCLTLKSDQIVWARSPVRLDLAGGWTDTPPYCLEYGGSVLNVAVMLNGQPPIQVICRRLAEPELRIRSIDLGVEERIGSYEEINTYHDPRGAFSLPKAAFALSGFHPEFYLGQAYPSLRQQLQDLGGGLELSLLCAMPKGSGLGTSSILAATLLGALNRACGLGLDDLDLYHRVMAMEQLLTTGGGWQDQAGALFRGVKLVQTLPGDHQHPTVRYLPEHLLGSTTANRKYLLYYTGLTRLAKGILQQIVSNMFLGDHATRTTLALIYRNSLQAYHAILTGNEAQLVRTIGRSWELNKRLDPDTTNPQIEAILATCGEDLAAAKLLGAGGGGYMLLCARDVLAGERLRARLEANPPNPLARFIDFAVADSGMVVTVS